MRFIQSLVSWATAIGVVMMAPAFAQTATFNDCNSTSWCPELAVVEGATIEITGYNFEDRTYYSETTSARRFAIGVTEVTFAQWDACYLDGGCSYSPDDFEIGRENTPVSNISWRDVQEYLRWLSRLTAQRYRLPTNTEWEIAARAGGGPRPWTGAGRQTANVGNIGNYGGSASRRPEGARDQWLYHQAPVRSFPANSYGLYDMDGNVWEFVSDCAVPRNASRCSHFLLRGGSFSSYENFTGADEHAASPSSRARTYGLRVARELN